MAIARGRLFGCPVELALTILGGKWKTILLARLKSGPMSYSEIRRAVPGLADKVLTQRLRDLERDGLIARTTAPKRGGYMLTPQARSLKPALEALYAWGEEEASRKGVRFRDFGK